VVPGLSPDDRGKHLLDAVQEPVLQDLVVQRDEDLLRNILGLVVIDVNYSCRSTTTILAGRRQVLISS
jgi:hypothetical protein